MATSIITFGSEKLQNVNARVFLLLIDKFMEHDCHSVSIDRVSITPHDKLNSHTVIVGRLLIGEDTKGEGKHKTKAFCFNCRHANDMSCSNSYIHYVTDEEYERLRSENPFRRIFKSVVPIEVQHERGTDFIQAEGYVEKITEDRVYLEGISYNFSISLKDFEEHNIK